MELGFIELETTVRAELVERLRCALTPMNGFTLMGLTLLMSLENLRRPGRWKSPGLGAGGAVSILLGCLDVCAVVADLSNVSDVRRILLSN